MVRKYSVQVPSLLLLTLLLLFSCRAKSPIVTEYAGESTIVAMATRLDSLSLLRSLSSFLSVDVIDSLFLLASPVQCDSPALAPNTRPQKDIPALIPVAARHMVVRAAAVENDTANSVLKTDGTTATTAHEQGGYTYYDPPPRSHDFAVYLLLSVALISCIILYKTRER